MEKIKEELRTLIGESILLFQRYEYTFKSLLTLSLIHGSIDSLKQNLSNRSDIFSKKSLGQLVRHYLDEVVDADDTSVSDSAKFQSPYIKMHFSVETGVQTKTDIEGKYKTFVDERNFVVHHLISELVPGDQLSYKAMISRISDINEKFEKDLQDLIQTRQFILDGYKCFLNTDELESLVQKQLH